MARYFQVLGNKSNPLYINDKPINLNGNRAILTKTNSNSWDSVSIPKTRGVFEAAVVFQGKIHILGGNGQGYHLTYDGKNFEDLSSNLPTGYDPQGCNVLVYNNELYVFGGGMSYSGTTASNKAFYKYDGSTWSEIYTSGTFKKTKDKTPKSGKTYYTRTNTEPYEYIEFTGSTFITGVVYYEHVGVKKVSLPYNFYVGSVALFDGEIHIFGGGASGSRKNHYVYRNETWSKSTSLPKGVRGLNNASLFINNGGFNYIAVIYSYTSGSIPISKSCIGKYSNAKKTKWTWDTTTNIGIYATTEFMSFVNNLLTDYKRLQYFYSDSIKSYIIETNGVSGKTIYSNTPHLDISSNVLYYNDEIIVITDNLYKTKDLYELTIQVV